MGDLTPVITSAVGLGAPTTVQSLGASILGGGLGQAIGLGRDTRDEDQALEQLQAQQALEEKQLKQQNDLRRRELATRTKAEEEERRRALRRSVARQRARFGAGGVGAAGGSSSAVLLGLFEESDEDRAEREALDNLRFKALSQDEANTRSVNILQQAQLKERQNLDRVKRFF